VGREQDSKSDTPSRFLQLPIDVQFEPTDDDLEYCLLTTSIIAIDIEYKPSFCHFCQADSETASILQVC
jgi:hypothetical protein